MSDSSSGYEPTGGTVLPANTGEFFTDQPRRDDVDLARAAGVGASYGHAWRMLKQYFGPLILIGLIAFVFSAVLGGVIGGLGAGLDAALDTRFFTVASNLIYQFAVGVPLTYGSLYAYLKAARGEGPELAQLFVPYRRVFGSCIVSNLLLALCVLAGMVLLVVPGIVVAVRLSFTPFLVVDEELGPREALAESWRRTRGYGWTIFGTWLLAIPIIVVGMLLLIVGVIPAIMWVYLAFASLYAAVTARQGEAQAGSAPAPALYL